MSCQAARTGDVLLAPPRRLLSQTQPPKPAAPSSTEPRLNRTLARHNLGNINKLCTPLHTCMQGVLAAPASHLCTSWGWNPRQRAAPRAVARGVMPCH